MVRILRILSSILSALAVAATPFLGIFVSVEFAFVGLGVAAAFFFATLLFKSFEQNRDDE